MSMSQPNVTIPLPPPGTIPFPPPGTNFLATLELSMPFLLTSTVLSSLLIPILLALLVFSTPQTRHHPMFVLNVLGVLLGLVEGALSIYLQVQTMLAPTAAEPLTTDVAFTVTSYFAPLVVECTLMIRLAIAYPRSSTSRVKFWSILLVPIIFKIIRLINISTFLHNFVDAIYAGPSYILAGESLWGDWQVKLEWILQAVDNAFVSFMFLRRLPRPTGASEGVVQSRTVAARLRVLFFIALSNFVFPVMLNIIQLSFIFGSTASFFRTSIVYIVNNYVTIIGVVFATIWSMGSRSLDESHPPARPIFSEDSTITSGRGHTTQGSQNFKSVNLTESIDLETKEARTLFDQGVLDISQHNDAYV
ncbi:hypothetical protein DFH29DRAFT_913144 [Suillus ampliporus]|nr:hypothetical protein DFH29DRAFT_913144 [Suillus ampliporus]